MTLPPADGRSTVAPPLPTARSGQRAIGEEVVPDDYVWMRDPACRDELESWLTAERTFHDQVATRYAARRDRLAARARELVAAEVDPPSWTAGSARWRWHRPTGAEHMQLLRRAEGDDPEAGEQVVLDVNALSGTGFVRVGDCVVDPTGSLVAYTLDTVGDEAYQLHVREVETGVDRILAKRCYYGLVWTPDGRRLLSVVHDHADRPHEVWVHDLAIDDASLLLREDDERFHVAVRSAGGGHAVIRSASRLSAEEWLVDLGTSGPLQAMSVAARREGRDYTVEPIEVSARPMLAVAVEVDGGRYRVVVQERGAPLGEGEEVLAAGSSRRPTELTSRDDTLVIAGRDEGRATLWLVDLTGARPTRTVTADIGSTLELAPYDAGGDAALCVSVRRRDEPEHWDALDLRTGDRTPLAAPPSPASAPVLVTERLEVAARDGVAVPVTVIRREDVALDGTAPCLLYGYGAWETVIEPAFDPVTRALIELGVVFAHAHVRGGGELGRDWWCNGRMEHKHRTFDDFEDVARHLASGRVDGRRIVARGLSAGGLLMGATYARAPELFAGILAEAPFVDPVTTMSDPDAPLVVVERDEWGDPRREADREWMLAWSPYDNLPPLPERPRLLTTSAVHDPRVSVWEPGRWVARLRATGSMDDGVLFRVDLGARGHWPPPGRSAGIAYQSELVAWIADTMEL